MTCADKRALAYEKADLTLTSDGQWGEYVEVAFQNSHLPRIYYFVVMDCEHITHMTYKVMPKIEVDFNIVNQLAEGDTVDHFSYEEQGTLGLHLSLLFIFTSLFGYAIFKCVRHQSTFQMDQSPFYCIILTLFFTEGNLFWKVIHLLMYSSNGKGIPFFDIVSLICQMLSEITFSVLLMLIGYGWTISFADLDIDNNLDVYLPIGSLVIVIHLALAALTYIDVDASHKYHDYSGIQGWVLILFKVGLFCYYMYCIRANRSKVPKRSEQFFRVFSMLGSAYMLAVPVTIVACYGFQPYNRQFVYTLTTNMVQLASIATMIHQHSSTRSQYFKASINSQGVLPLEKTL